MRHLGSLFLLLMLAAPLVGCGTDNPFSRGPEVLTDDDTVIPPTAGTVSFSNDVEPLLSACISCHRGGTGGWTYTGNNAFAEASAAVSPNAPENSLLLVKASGGNGHGGGTLFGRNSAQYQAILLWIEAGAPDN